ncbi:MAG: alpha-galactosidase [Planctomycetia bacterium]|nr:alpha-galactosidase [Planctomycetia bacterium]
MLRQLMFAAVLCGMTVSRSVQAVQPTADEMDAARRWVGAKFDNTPDDRQPPVQPGLVVVVNYDPVQKNARAGKPMNVAGKQFTRGLYCHATSKLIVRLPSPGKSLSAVVGVDSNDQTSGGRGSIVFSVDVGPKAAFRSELMREGMPGVEANVDLGGATEFVLGVGDGGDGFGCDQADWADAKVVLADGKTVWLGDLPLIEPPPRAYTTEPPFSFTYGGRPSAELLSTWPCQRSARKLDEQRTEHVATWTDSKTGLEARCVAVAYSDFPTVEWTLYFKNTGTADTPILENIQGLDATFDRGGKGEYTLHHYRGSPCLPTDYEPFETPLGPGASKRITAAGGRPSNSDLPYFNVGWPEQGVVLAVGWPGQWAAEFARDAGTGLRIRAGQELTHLKLHPGEEIRSPLIAVQIYHGDRIRSQNVWRRWMLAHNLPRPGGKLPPSHLAACSSHQFGEMINADSASQKLFVDRYLEEGLKLDYWWMDAGWYICDGSWPKVGTWEVDQKRFPGGLRPICDHTHAKGVKTIVWFEPERVAEGTWLFEKHPEWLLGSGSTRLLNLGNPEARTWLTDHIDRFLTEQGIDLYRQDFNMDPLGFWRANDAEDRQGITENGHVTGYLAYWDELRRRHPNMLIDSCASGGRRNDLETLRRAVPLLRSDYIMDPIGNQGHTYGISFWMPFYGTGTGSGVNTPYALRSALCPAFTACFDTRRKDLDYEMLRRVINGWRSYAPNFFGDYYPLTAYSLDPKVWIAWQFDCPERGEGMVQVFRRPESVYESARFTLCGLSPDARYALVDLDGGQKFEAMTGRELAERGVVIAAADRPGAVVVTYKRIK